MKLILSFALSLYTCNVVLSTLQDDFLTQQTGSGFSQEVYEKLQAGGDEVEFLMAQHQRKRAVRESKRLPVLGGSFTFLTYNPLTTGASFCVAHEWTCDEKGRFWYVIDRNGQNFESPVFASLTHKVNAAYPFELENIVVVRSTALKAPSKYGFLYTLRNNVDVGKPVVFQFTLYPL